MISSGPKGAADPGVGVGGGHLAEAGPQRADACPVLGQCPPVGGAQRVLEERVGLNRQEDAAGHLEVGRPGPLGPEQGGTGCPLGRLAGPVHGRFRRVAPGGATGVQRLGPRHQDDAEVAAGDGTAGVVQQRLRRVAPDGGQHELGGHVGVEAEPVGHQEGGVDGAPSQRHHHPDAVGPPDQGIPGGGRPSRRGARGVLGGRPQRPHHQLEGLGPFGGVGAGIGVDGDLADPDDDRCVGMQGHAPGIVPADAPGSPGPLGRLGLHARRLRLGPCRVLSQGDPQGRAPGRGHDVVDVGTVERRDLRRLPPLRRRGGPGRGRGRGGPGCLRLRLGKRDRHGGQQGPRCPGRGRARRDHRQPGPAAQPRQRRVPGQPGDRCERGRRCPDRLPLGARGGGTARERIAQLALLDRELVHNSEGTP